MERPIDAVLIDKMGDDLTTVNAARVSYGAVSSELSERDGKLIDFLAEHNHVTPFRHAHVTLRCRAPIFLARQLGKHQVGFSWNEVSRRYKDGKAIPLEFYIPSVVFGRPNNLMKETARPMPLDFTNNIQEEIVSASAAAYKTYERLVESGVAPEQARMVLPQNMITEWVWTGSLYGFANLYKQRSDEHAQFEAREFADIIDKIMLVHFPVTWRALTK